MNDYIKARQNALEKYFSNINEMQREAVCTVKGPVLILAGAGSGKTTVLVNRVANMILFGDAYNDDSIISPNDMAFLEVYDGQRDYDSVSKLRDIIAIDTVNAWNILAITFTNKAAKELKDRLVTMLGEDCARDINASTFHSACVRILRREIDKLGYSNAFTIYDSDDSQRVIKSCMSDLDISDKMFAPKSVLAAISSAKDKLQTPDDMIDESKGDYRKIKIAEIYKEYQKRLKSANALDFDDIIMLTVKLFEQNDDVLSHYQNLYKYVMVDEYQDTNQAQYKLVSLLAKRDCNLCVVGDDDQSIYRFRGATIENILSFEKQFDGCKVIRLEQNYRSTQNILNAANDVIANNIQRKEKSLWTKDEKGECITIYKANDEQSEAKYIAKQVQKAVSEGEKYNDFAVLYRMNAQSNSIERAFSTAHIPYRVIGGMRFLDRKEVKDMLAYLHVIANPFDMLRFKRIINEPKRSIGDATVSMIEQISNDLGVSPIDVMKDSDTYAPLTKKANVLQKYAAMFEDLADKAGALPLDELYTLVLKKTGYEAMLKSSNEVEDATRLENVLELKSSISDYLSKIAEYNASISEDDIPMTASLSGFLEEISLSSDIDKLDPDADAVCMMTIHSAKGLEFPTVFIAGAEEGIFPGNRSMTSKDDIEEERRLAYVGITRARKKLYMTYAKQRMLYGSTSRNFQSRFIKEISDEYIEKLEEVTKTEAQSSRITETTAFKKQPSQTLSVFQRKTVTAESFNVGDKILHEKFGEGMIISAKPMGNDKMLEIAFDTVGTKKIMATYSKITKL